MKRRSLAITVVAMILATPTVAQAHLVNSGLGPFYDGAMHLVLSPDDALGLLALSLLAGLRGPTAGRWTFMVLPVAWFLAGLVGLALPGNLDLPWLSVLSFVVLGVLVAVDPKLPPIAVGALAALFGALHGLLNGSALAIIGAGPLSLFGIVVAGSIVALIVSAAIVPLRAAWARVAVRVAGSWVAAVGMLMFGWLTRGTGP